MTIKCPGNMLLKNYLIGEGYHLRTSCGGRGNCGKCAVKVIEGNAPANTMDRMWFTEKQIQEGYRLGCQIFSKEELTIELEAGGN